MTLIEEIPFQDNLIRFYSGIDFDRLIKHPKDGSDGFIFCFIKNWKNEVNSHNRNSKLKSIIEDINYEKFQWESINNDFISIYQTEGIGYDVVYRTIKNKIINQQFPDQPWIPINSISTGAWKIK
jgi:hypothetical protein